VQTGSNINNKDINFNADDVETVILKAHQIAQRMTISVGMSVDLIKNNLFDIQRSSQLAKELLKSNSLTESEILIIDDKDSDEEDYDEEDYDEEADGQEAVDEEYGSQEAGDEEFHGQVVDEEYDDQEVGEDYNDQEADDEGDYDQETVDEECDDEGDYIEESNDEAYDHITPPDDAKPTPSFENLQATSYSGVY
jgi:hypothetical protein